MIPDGPARPTEPPVSAFAGTTVEGEGAPPLGMGAPANCYAGLAWIAPPARSIGNPEIRQDTLTSWQEPFSVRLEPDAEKESLDSLDASGDTALSPGRE